MGNTKEIIRKFNIKLTKSLGQNFLTDETVIKHIINAADINNNDIVIEVGPGIGNMTRELALYAGKVIAIEIDKHLIPALAFNLKDLPNAIIVNEDVLKVNFKDIITGNPVVENTELRKGSVKVVANLPYYITTPVIMKFLEENPGIDSCVFMIQKEVADRMTAKPGGKDYGALSVAVQFYSKPEKVFDVPPHCFIPQPNVDSTVIKLSIHKTPPVELVSEGVFFKTIKAAFGQRRKTLVNALSNSGYFMKNKDEIKEILKNIGIGENQRGETLSILQFAQLSNAFSVKNS